MEILRELPKELKWNVLKYLQHPTAEIMRPYLDLDSNGHQCMTLFAAPSEDSYWYRCGEYWQWDRCVCCASMCVSPRRAPVPTAQPIS